MAAGRASSTAGANALLSPEWKHSLISCQLEDRQTFHVASDFEVQEENEALTANSCHTSNTQFSGSM